MNKQEEISLETFITDDLGQEFKAIVTFKLSEVEKALNAKGYKIVK